MKLYFFRATAIGTSLFAAALFVSPALAAPFSVTNLQPRQAFTNVSTEYSASYASGSYTVDHCRLSVGGDDQGLMTLVIPPVATISKFHSISTPGSYTVRVTCYDGQETVSAYTQETVTIYADSSSPAIGTYILTPSSPIAGSPVTIQANYDDTDFGSGVSSCSLYVDGSAVGLMDLSVPNGTAGNASLATTVATAGSHNLTINCTDRSGNTGARAQTITFSAPTDSASPVVSSITPFEGTVNVSVSIKAIVSDNVGITSCSLSVGGVSQGSMTIAGGEATRAHTFTSTGDHTLLVRCYDAAENMGNLSGSIRIYSAATDASAPVINTISPTSAVVGTSAVIRAYVGDNIGVTSCTLRVNGVNQGSMTLDAGEAIRSYAFPSTGDQTVLITCYDAVGNAGTRSATVTVSPIALADTAAPVVAQIASVFPVQNITTTISATYSDNVGVTACTLYVNGINWGYMALSGTTSGTASTSFAFNPSGVHTVYISCSDAAGNTGTGMSRAITVGTSSSADFSPPVVTILTSALRTGSPLNISASFSDNLGVASCSLYVNDVYLGPMSRSGTINGYADRTHSFSSAGTAYLRVSCSDAAGNTGNASRAIDVSSATAGTYAYQLVKLVCPTGLVNVNHACKAVYYVDGAGKRHAFPNERVYFSWYANFNNVYELDSATLSSFTLSKNVSYRPGTRMVKFTTLNRVYAVGRYGNLRWVTSEAIASGLYGSDWNRKIDDISDAFYTDYTFGTDISTTASFNPANEAATASDINLNL